MSLTREVALYAVCDGGSHRFQGAPRKAFHGENEDAAAAAFAKAGWRLIGIGEPEKKSLTVVLCPQCVEDGQRASTPTPEVPHV